MKSRKWWIVGGVLGSLGVVLIGGFFLSRTDWFTTQARKFLEPRDLARRTEADADYVRKLDEALSGKDVAVCDDLPEELRLYERNDENVVHYNEANQPDYEVAFPKSQCKIGYALRTLDESVCSLFVARTHCYLELANELKLQKNDRYKAVCQNISQTETQKRCLDTQNVKDQKHYFTRLRWGT